MVRWMSVRLWAELRWQMPPGKAGVPKQRTCFVNTQAGRWVIARSGFSKITNRREIADWKRNPVTQELDPVYACVEKTTKLSAKKQAAPARAIGKELAAAVEHGVGKAWTSDPQLLRSAYAALAIELTA